ncbi:bacteriochlorophyll synthase [Thermocladium modestius]|uniref:Bacteriochlorophyll synthase n=1 Tax=Thermocladium modestius TaxID=62609 RepID=A0A830GUW3_9CREN|nr:NAD(P)/FAD-dependent oxidoreductase [Thermocladium modestius]GGP20002.1 bacteriochlorophyll synthase [Thermocladium modestius]
MDLMIVGAGPGGSFTALEAVRKEFNVTLIDKKSARYGPIVCGELLPSKDLLANYLPSRINDLLAYTLDVVLSRDVIINRIKRLNVILGDVSIGSFPFDSLVIDKGAMIRHVIDAAEQGGAKVLFSTTVTGCVVDDPYVKCSVKGRDGESFMVADKAVGADAYPSTLSELAGASEMGPRDLIVATSQRAAGRFDDEEAMIIMDPRLAPGGYAWIFPRGDGTHNTGIGVRGDAAWGGGASVLDLHRRFIDKFGLRPLQRAVLSKTIPVGGLVRARGGAYLVGDAVGSVIPTNGAGINPAMITGKLVVDSMIQGIDYYSLLYSVFGSFMKRMVDYRKLADPILYDYEAVKRLLKFPKPLLRTALRDAVMGSSKASTSLMLGILSPLINSLVASQRKH